ncbi:protein phosphatase 2C domain-containing protein [Trichothermofontia sichuanensis B231]|uniref:protein phosphatase 2C domain-containing protein n=1 Tax=Trichothermofontia sichuanensis TaxID=3045816 RepID=UPI002247319A|nr:protein phosphatase 2C domain-containing protein [Trichothermofontia sichuanensis]UZQ56014.1 protein phosphatase 2C domain-containing protein [Trichothermofontia sichuanensis B231]
MDKAVVNISCVNPECQAPNPTEHHFCQQCQTPLVKRYLWALNPIVETYEMGAMLSDRYFHVQGRVLLDTQPQRLPAMPTEISNDLAAYLSLMAWRLHIPQPYGLLYLPEHVQTVVLLEEAPLNLAVLASPERATASPLLPSLREAWPQASPLRQLNWLWQMAQLWAPLQREGAVSSLLDPELLRVEGPWVRLLALAFDRDRPETEPPPTLAQLGTCWRAWFTDSQPVLAPFLSYLWEQLQQRQVPNAEYLTLWLDQALFQYHTLHSEALEKLGVVARSLQIVTQTDRGPSRDCNEDACYPTAVPTANPTNQFPLAIVCDGLGGHEGGSIASGLAIATLPNQIKKLPLNRSLWQPHRITTGLEQAVYAANDAINQRNNEEHRHERQRMGTTLVMALADHHEVYITHVGDSRLYWITRHGCHQITLDDDIASRDARLGYCLYREAIQGSIGGALVQAVGMGPASQLYPTTQRFVVDEDCVLLLCSDGLSDGDRVEQFWQTELLPILTEQRDVVTVSQRLVALANHWNGHDNVTVALMVYRLAQTPAVSLDAQTLLVRLTPTPSLPDAPTQLEAESLMALSETVTTGIRTEILAKTPVTAGRSRRWGILLGSMLVALGLGGLGLWLSNRLAPLGLTSPLAPPTPSESLSVPLDPVQPSPKPTASPEPTSPATTAIGGTPSPGIGQIVTLERVQILWPAPEPSLSLTTHAHLAQQLPPGSWLQLLRQQTVSPDQSWFQVRLCGLPNVPTGETRGGSAPPRSTVGTAPVGAQGWLRLEANQPWTVSTELPTNLDRACVLPTPSASPIGGATDATDSPAVPLPPRPGESPNG